MGEIKLIYALQHYNLNICPNHRDRLAQHQHRTLTQVGVPLSACRGRSCGPVFLAGVSYLRPTGHVQPMGHAQSSMAVNVAQHKIVNLPKTLWNFFVITCHNVFNVWLKTTLPLPVWPRDARRLDTPVRILGSQQRIYNNALWRPSASAGAL